MKGKIVQPYFMGLYLDCAQCRRVQKMRNFAAPKFVRAMKNNKTKHEQKYTQ